MGIVTTKFKKGKPSESNSIQKLQSDDREISLHNDRNKDHGARDGEEIHEKLEYQKHDTEDTEESISKNVTNIDDTKHKRDEIQHRKLEFKTEVHTTKLTVTNFIGNETDITKLLEKVLRKTFVLKKYCTSENDTSCIVEFPGANELKDATKSFLEHNTTSNIKILITKQECEPQTVTNHSLYLNKMTDEARNVLSLHQQKVEQIEQKMKDILHFEECNWRQGEEKRTLKFKLQKMENQKSEFEELYSYHIQQLDRAKDEKKDDAILNEVYTTFQRECNRLRNALPMYAKRTEISSMVKDNQVSLLLGETGSGKSTQIAQYLYQAKLANSGLIVCTQPRKIAAISLATHVAQEMGTSVGDLVGYKVGMQAKISHNTRIVYVTDHMLLNECLKDKSLSTYSCIIVDEAHERSIYTDLLLGMIKKCVVKRKDLRVVITSATIDPAVFVGYFGEECPVLSVAGRMFPVDIEWTEDEYANDQYEEAALEKTIQVHQTEEKGDILTFLTSPLEVEKCCSAFSKTLSKEDNFICLPLHGRLQANEQQKVFDPPPNGKRKIVFATNSAETSITIPGIKYVIDTGMAREMQFDPKRNINTLCVTNVTKSSADQRKGRAGRTESGKCFRLYSAETYSNMETSSRPEMLRVHLGQALLKLMELGVEPLDFDFVQAPPRQMMDAAIETLTLVGAVMNSKITDLGRWIAKLPLDPKFGGFVYQAIEEDVGIEALVLSACCSTGGSIFYRSGTDERKSVADTLKVRFCHEGGDLLTMLNVYREWHIQPEKEKGTWCSKNSINGKAVRGIQDTVNEVLNVLIKDTGLNLKFKFNSPSDVDLKLQKMLFDTFKGNICRFLGHEKAGYLVVVKNRIVQQFPGSPLKMLGLQPDWIVMEQTLKTYTDFAVNVTTVKNEWVQEEINDGRLQIDLENINRRRVEQVATFEVGEQVYKDFVGIRHSKLKELEDEIKAKNTNIIAYPLASKEWGEIEVYAQQNCEHISTMIKERLDNLKQQMKQIKSEQFLSSPNSGVRVILGAGLNLDDVLMPNEYKSIIIYGNPVNLETKGPKDMIEIFEQYGKIVHIEQFRTNKNKQDWGKIMFETKENAENAVRLNTTNLDINARPSINLKKTDTHVCRCRLEWCRRPSKGYGFVRFKDPLVLQRLFHEPVSIGESFVKIKPSKSHESEIHVCNLNQNVNEDILRQGFEDALTITSADIDRVSVIRHKVNTSPHVLESFRHRIDRKLAEYVQRGTYDVEIKTPKDTDFTHLAFVTFSNPEEGQNACRGIDQRFELNNAVISMKMDLKSSIIIPLKVYEKYKIAVESLANKGTKSERNTIRTKQLKNGNVVIEIHSDSVETHIRIKGDILQEIKGHIMDKESNDNISLLFTRDGRELMKRLMEKTDTNIIADERILSVTIHGSENGKENVIKALQEYLNELKIGEIRNISLKGVDKPPGIMKELILLYEFDLHKLKTDTGLKYLKLDLRSHIVTAFGDTQSVNKCSRVIEDVISSIIEKRSMINLEPSHDRVCVICFCPIEGGEMYRLEICGHACCKDCVALQFKSMVQSNDFPITCSSEGCNEPWAWKDLERMSSKTGIAVTELVKKATNSFVTKNKNEYRFCLTADCPIIYRVSESENLFTCPDCQIRICTACHDQFHDGLRCKSVEAMEEDNNGLDLWMQQNSENAKYCPKCRTPIEKIEGCHHMTCLGCNSHICWMCLAYFASGQECYGHMQASHGTFV